MCSWMRLAAEVLTMLRDPYEDQCDGGYSSDGRPETMPWQYSDRNHLSVLIQRPDADLSHIPAEAVVALVQAVGDALEQTHSREELVQCCAKVRKCSSLLFFLATAASVSWSACLTTAAQ